MSNDNSRPRRVFPTPPQRPVIQKLAVRSVETPPVLSEDVLLRHGARVLDPASAAQPARSRRERENRRLATDDAGRAIPYSPTAYVADQILLTTGSDPGSTIEALRKVGERLEMDFEPVPADVQAGLVRLREDRLRQLTQDQRSAGPVIRVNLRSTKTTAAPPPDAWEVVQQLRDDPDTAGVGVSLNHLLVGTGTAGTTFNHGVTFNRGVTFNHGVADGAAQYSVPGWGGRGPVAWLGDPPARTPVERRPVVAIIDTGVADHPWLAEGVTRLRFDPDTRVVVVADDDGGKETDPDLIDPLAGQLDDFFGHGTFIAGLIRQGCPDADLVSIRLMGQDGVVEEAGLLLALDHLADRQAAAQAGDPANVVDIVSLSLGYYHEAPADLLDDSPLLARLDTLRSLGVAVVAAAGNDSTSRSFYPAAMTAFHNGQLVATPFSSAIASAAGPEAEKWPPLVSVGALNPDGSVALFSNGGAWVACYCPGAVLVSTVPITNAGASAGFVLGEAGGADQVTPTWRSTVDPDNFTGFGTWSGTSFAAPVLAAEIARLLLGSGDLTTVDPSAGSQRIRAALADLGFLVS